MASQFSKRSDDRRFLIVTPVFNAERFIDEVILSVLTQSPSGIPILYHIQDGGSKDGTLDKLLEWDARLRSGSFPSLTNEVVFSFASDSDDGMYDALNRGFNCLAPRDSDIMAWINSDDRLAQGALATVAQVLNDVTDCEFLSGRIAMLNETGAVMVLGHPLPYARAALIDGLHDGRKLPFLMQEGTFFSGRLWKAVDGVDESFRLAGDWDLWRRMARVANHFLVDTVTGYHRRRAGQLSGDMAHYYQEIDASPREASLPSVDRLGTVVTYDQASARWVAGSYDPEVLAMPTLLRDGKIEQAAICRPVAGFGAPEGPYPQYGLPGGIRWIDESHATISVSIPATGRYRIRLTLRPACDGVVLGISSGMRQSQPISLPAPLAFVNQVIETDRWLNAGESNLILDCGLSAGARSVLLISCEVVSTDEAFFKKPILPLRNMRALHNANLAIAIFCEDDEPDLLERSLHGCADLVLEGASVFVVSDPGNANLNCVISSSGTTIAGTFDIGGPEGNVDLLRYKLLETHKPYAVIIRRGEIVKPLGIDAAIVALSEGGAGTAVGLIDERDSAGRALQLAYSNVIAPTMYSAAGDTMTKQYIGTAIAQTVAAAHIFRQTPVVWLLDADKPIFGRTPLALMAAALSSLGFDARHVVVSGLKVPDIPPGAAKILSSALSDARDAEMSVRLEAGRLRLLVHNYGTMVLPLAIDTDLMLPRDRTATRSQLGFALDERIYCIAEYSAEATAELIAYFIAMKIRPSKVFNFGAPFFEFSDAIDIINLDHISDPEICSYFLSVADGAITSSSDESIFSCGAASCGIKVVTLRELHSRVDGLAATIDPTDTLRISTKPRDLLVATRSIPALAIAISSQCSQSRKFEWLTASPSLRSGALKVRSYRSFSSRAWQDLQFGPTTIIPLKNSSAIVAPSGQLETFIPGHTADIIAYFGRSTGTDLRVHVRGRPGDSWLIRAGANATQLCVGPDGVETTSITGQYQSGPICLNFKRLADESAAPEGLYLEGCSLIGEGAISDSEWQETMFELIPADAWPVADLEVDGDWQRVSGFLAEEPPVPQEGLHNKFRWTCGLESSVRMRCAVSGSRALRVALSAGIRNQRLRLVVGARVYDWCEPLIGPIGHIEYRQWLVDWPAGDVEVTFELSDVLHAPGQDLGMILFGLTLNGPCRVP